MEKRSWKKIGLIILLFFVITLTFSYFVVTNYLPENLSITKNTESTLQLYFPFDLYVKGKQDLSLTINGKKVGSKYLQLESGKPIVVKGQKIGHSSLNIKLFGLIPIKTLNINILPEVKVIPGGQAIGVLLRSKGVMVVGNSFVEGENGTKYYPAREAGIEVGDTILSLNGKTINDKVALAKKIQNSVRNKPEVTLKVKKKNGSIKNINLKPIKNRNGKYMIGLYVDDGVAGVGTLTFYDPNSKEYGALGHVITEGTSQTKIAVRQGHIVNAQISGINFGRKGIPGEKQGTFFQENDALGKIRSNTKFGIYGSLNRIPKNPYFKKGIPVATISQVKTGPAKIYTVIRGGKIEEFQIDIERVYRQSFPDSKGMVIKVTDPDLRKMTGGIIQGMSGSPIVQNGKLVGAITHVFINNPTKGYGVFAEWMLSQTNIYNKGKLAN